MKIKINQSGILLLIAGFFLIIIGGLINDPVLCTIVAAVFWLIGMIYALRNIKHNFALLGYNVGFFAFILGGYTFDLIKESDFSFFSNSYFSASSSAINHTCFCVMLTAVIINSAYIAFHGKKDEISGIILDYNSSKIKKLQNIIVIVLIVSYICNLYCSVVDMILVKTVSYRESVQYVSGVSTIIVSLSSLYYIILFIYWSTLPSKRAILISIISLLFVELINLLAGDRGNIVSIVFVVGYYISFRNRAGFTDIQIKKKIIVVIIFLLPFIMYGLQAVSYTRNGQTYEAGLLDGITSFMESQGGSVKIVANAYDLDEEICSLVDGKRSFVYGEIKGYLTSNIFARLLTGKTVGLRTVEDAKSGESFLRSYGYAYSPITYNSGVGSGSTYIAEVYYDGGYIFLAIFNLLIVVLLFKMSSNKSNSIVKNAIMLNIFRYIPMLPRGMALGWLTNTFAIQNIFIYVVLTLYLQGGITLVNSDDTFCEKS